MPFHAAVRPRDGANHTLIVPFLSLARAVASSSPLHHATRVVGFSRTGPISPHAGKKPTDRSGTLIDHPK